MIHSHPRGYQLSFQSDTKESVVFLFARHVNCSATPNLHRTILDVKKKSNRYEHDMGAAWKKAADA